MISSIDMQKLEILEDIPDFVDSPQTIPTSEFIQVIRQSIALKVMDRLSYMNAQDVIEISMPISEWIISGDKSFAGLSASRVVR